MPAWNGVLANNRRLASDGGLIHEATLPGHDPEVTAALGLRAGKDARAIPPGRTDLQPKQMATKTNLRGDAAKNFGEARA